MDYGITKNPGALRAALDSYVPGITPDVAVKAAVRGRNNWIVWTAGNDRLWDVLSRSSAGNLDLLKTLSNHPSLKANRDNRWKELGLVNEPCFRKATGPREDRWGLWLDERVRARLRPRSVREREKYPGVKIGARGTGKLAGRLVLRLCQRHRRTAAVPEPRLRREGRRRPGTRSATTPTELLQPQGPGAAVPRRHVVRLLPRRTEPGQSARRIRRIPSWANLSCIPGAQYIWVDRIFIWNRTNEAARTTSTSSSTLPARARSTPRWSRPTASTIRAR